MPSLAQHFTSFVGIVGWLLFETVSKLVPCLRFYVAEDRRIPVWRELVREGNALQGGKGRKNSTK